METQSTDYGSSVRVSTLKAGHLFAAEIAAVHGYSLNELRDHDRRPDRVKARWAIFWALRSDPYRWSLPRIGKLMDRDHTTVMYGIDRVARERLAMTVANQP